MANNDKSKTSKTARVMNLLSKKSSAPEPPVEDPASPGQPVPEAKPASHTPPILDTIGADAAASNQIKNALEDALEAELAPPAPQPEPQPQPEPAPQPEPEPEPDPLPEMELPAQPEPEPEPQPSPEPPSAAQYAAMLQTSQTPAEEFGYINVMQVLVEEKAPKYMKMFDMCTCRRCLEDVKALALNHLPPKYVVLAENEMIPKLTFYEGKFNSDITAQLLKACGKVAERPHHKRS